MVEITAQNHNYNVPDEITTIADVTHKNLFDNTIEGLTHHQEFSNNLCSNTRGESRTS